MREESHNEILKEVTEEIEAALKDKNGLLAYQRRLAFAISLGAVNLLEIHFHKQGVIKEGSKVNHRWFGKNKEKILEQLQKQITAPISSLENINEILESVIRIEEKRNDLAYGAPSTEKILQEKINLFFELKRAVKC